jgi:hypothetical protein
MERFADALRNGPVDGCIDIGVAFSISRGAKTDAEHRIPGATGSEHHGHIR